ncbi:MAG: NAD(P)-binding protein [Methanobacteriota archaeon]
MKTITIAGAGISGLCCAITLKKAGYPVEVFEKRKECGARFNGDLQGLENWSSETDTLDEIQKMNITPSFLYKPFTTMHLTDGKEGILIVSSKPIFYLLKRGTMNESLDQSLKNQALDHGVRIHFQSKKDVQHSDIIATGPNTQKITAVAKGITFETEADDIAVALVNKKTSYHGYAYLLIHNGYGCINTVNAYGFGSVNTCFNNAVEMFTTLYDLDIKQKRSCGGVGSFLLKQRIQRGEQRFVGEAAGLQDFLWGFGMRYAFTSGYLAAQSIIENTNYKTLVRQNLSTRLKASIVNRFYVEKLDDYGRVLINHGKTIPEGKHIILLNKAYNLSLYGRIVYPLAKLYLWKKFKDIV